MTILFDCGSDFAGLLDCPPLTSTSNPPSNYVQFRESKSEITASTDTTEENRQGYKIWISRMLLDCVPQLDFIIISNSQNIYTLPYITERYGFKGQILATEPTVQLGRQLLLELCLQASPHLHSTNDRFLSSKVGDHSENGKIFKNPLEATHEPHNIFFENEVNLCFDKIRPCSFDERIKIIDGLEVSPHSSGYMLGASNWEIRTEFEKICLISHTAVTTPSSFKNHSTPFKYQWMHNCDVMLFSQVTLTRKMSLDLNYADFCNKIGATVSNHGSVVIPISNIGLILDLIQMIDTYLTNCGFNKTKLNIPSSFSGSSAPPSFVPIYYISNIASTVLAYANISAEWVNNQKLEKAFLPTNPFVHSDLIDDGKLTIFNSINDNEFMSKFRTPSIILVNHPSLRFGDVLSLISLFKENPKNAVIFTDPSFDSKQAMKPFEPYRMACHDCSIDGRLSAVETGDLITKFNPKIILVPNQVKQSLEHKFIFSTINNDTGTNSTGNASTGNGSIGNIVSSSSPAIPDMRPLHHLVEVDIPLNRKFERGVISPELAAAIKPNISHGMVLTPIKASLVNFDGEYVLKLSKSISNNQSVGESHHNDMDIDQKEKAASVLLPGTPAFSTHTRTAASGTKGIEYFGNRLWGSPAPRSIMIDLEELNLDPIVEVNQNEELVIQIPQLEASVVFSNSSTLVDTNRTDSRKFLKELILKHCKV